MSTPMWKVIHAFGSDAVGPGAGNVKASVATADLLPIAERSTIRYWTDGSQLWSESYLTSGRTGIHEVSASRALALFGIDRLYEARERGTA